MLNSPDMKIIFLDIDGVLNSQLFYTHRKQYEGLDKKEFHKNQIDSRNIVYLNQLIAETDAKVVLSSTWRMGNSLEYMQSLLKDKGFTGELIDYTPVLRYPGAVRGNEIKAWIDENIKSINPDIIPSDFKEYVIFDDDSDMLLEQRNNYIQVDVYCGLTPNQCYRAKFILCPDMTFSKSFK